MYSSPLRIVSVTVTHHAAQGLVHCSPGSKLYWASLLITLRSRFYWKTSLIRALYTVISECGQQFYTLIRLRGCKVWYCCIMLLHGNILLRWALRLRLSKMYVRGKRDVSEDGRWSSCTWRVAWRGKQPSFILGVSINYTKLFPKKILFRSWVRNCQLCQSIELVPQEERDTFHNSEWLTSSINNNLALHNYRVGNPESFCQDLTFMNLVSFVLGK